MAMDTSSPRPGGQAGAIPAGLAGLGAALATPRATPGHLPELDQLLNVGRQLSSAKALLDVIGQVMDDVALLTDEAGRVLGLLCEPGLPESSWDAALLRYRHAFHEILALLAASRNVGAILLQGQGDPESGLARSLQRMDGIAGLLPRAPAERREAMQTLPHFEKVRMAVDEARDSFTLERRQVEAQLAMNLERLDHENEAMGALEDTDLTKEASRLQALQIRQQLAGHAIGLGALVPRCLQDLRGG
ncbi:hypothetical protein HMPREF0731_3375 [Pseudoroseomonas cervicalis ATCC 49957]|uniref:Uncharacterized protein n=2 Tax=Teichococcus cervicalis TaxID=204525 RepID=D5RQL3_9PROT|nr:hypothetical protein HMPREF0731_3375 [Pseudoroseomonas cervicalis ATCC 49957]